MAFTMPWVIPVGLLLMTGSLSYAVAGLRQVLSRYLPFGSSASENSTVNTG
jgi:hypothetical protein